jgi:predicted flap endonuclease-1-like 5' DNA nuclease
MPFHTGQSTAENNIHRAVEWSISQSYDALVANRRNLTPPAFPIESSSDWLRKLILFAAEESHRHYQTLIDHYDFAVGVKDPPAGLDATSRDVVAKLLHLAMHISARVLDRVVAESRVRPPTVNLSIPTLLAGLTVPIKWVTNRLADSSDRQQVLAIFAELQSTGQVEKHLPEENRVIRREAPAHSAAARKPSPTPDASILPPATFIKQAPAVVAAAPSAPAAAKAPLDRPRDKPVSIPLPKVPAPEPAQNARFNLNPDDDVVDAPTIGPKMAGRLKEIGVYRVGDLLKGDPATIAAGLKSKHIDADTIRQWQDQARLVCEIPEIHGHDAQILVGSGYRDVSLLADASLDELTTRVESFVKSSMGQRILRSGQEPDRQEMAEWIKLARQVRPLKAA